MADRQEWIAWLREEGNDRALHGGERCRDFNEIADLLEHDAAVLEEVKKELSRLRSFNDEQIAARRGEMSKWVRVEDVEDVIERADSGEGE